MISDTLKQAHDEIRGHLAKDAYRGACKQRIEELLAHMERVRKLLDSSKEEDDWANWKWSENKPLVPTGAPGRQFLSTTNAEKLDEALKFDVEALLKDIPE